MKMGSLSQLFSFFSVFHYKQIAWLSSPNCGGQGALRSCPSHFGKSRALALVEKAVLVLKAVRCLLSKCLSLYRQEFIWESWELSIPTPLLIDRGRKAVAQLSQGLQMWLSRLTVAAEHRAISGAAGRFEHWQLIAGKELYIRSSSMKSLDYMSIPAPWNTRQTFLLAIANNLFPEKYDLNITKLFCVPGQDRSCPKWLQQRYDFFVCCSCARSFVHKLHQLVPYCRAVILGIRVFKELTENCGGRHLNLELFRLFIL